MLNAVAKDACTSVLQLLWGGVIILVVFTGSRPSNLLVQMEQEKGRPLDHSEARATRVGCRNAPPVREAVVVVEN